MVASVEEFEEAEERPPLHHYVCTRVSPPPTTGLWQAAANKNAKIVRIGVVNGHAPRPCVQGDRVTHTVENRTFSNL